MTTRDRLMLIGVVGLALLLGVWFMAVSPEREQAAKVTAEVESARQQLSSATSQATSAASARAKYSTAYASLVSLGQAVPAASETPSLIYALAKATHSRNVQFSSITSGGPNSGGSSASSAPAAMSTGFSQQPFTFVFSGNFVDLYKLLFQLEALTLQSPSGTLRVNGRLLTINSINLSPAAAGAQGSSKSSNTKAPPLTTTITATAYVLPTGESALGGATPAGPNGTASGTPAAASPSTSPATPALIKAPTP
ncbi:MAG TPA: type II secretion system protein GspM [Solirubrobacteraceae bacterium]|jgi:hypothetical protein